MKNTQIYLFALLYSKKYKFLFTGEISDDVAFSL